jgi:plasmid stabilization system protein ParE
LPPIARRFHGAVMASLDALIARPDAGSRRAIGDALPDGPRASPVKGFDGVWIYYLAEPERLTVLRVLHDKRDIGIALEARDLQAP